MSESIAMYINRLSRSENLRNLLFISDQGFLTYRLARYRIGTYLPNIIACITRSTSQDSCDNDDHLTLDTMSDRGHHPWAQNRHGTTVSYHIRRR